MNKDSKMLAEAYDRVEDLKGWTKAGMDSAQIASGKITRLENKVIILTKALQKCVEEMKHIAQTGHSLDRGVMLMATDTLAQVLDSENKK